MHHTRHVLLIFFEWFCSVGALPFSKAARLFSHFFRVLFLHIDYIVDDDGCHYTVDFPI